MFKAPELMLISKHISEVSASGHLGVHLDLHNKLAVREKGEICRVSRYLLLFNLLWLILRLFLATYILCKCFSSKLLLSPCMELLVEQSNKEDASI